jgi:hypothetical protein
MKHKVIILSGTETHRFLRSAGPYRIATELKLNGYNTKVLPVKLYYFGSIKSLDTTICRN